MAKVTIVRYSWRKNGEKKTAALFPLKKTCFDVIRI